MDTEWGGLYTLLAAAKFVELQEQEKNQKLIEICEEYPSSDKSSYSTESASSLTPVQSVVASPSPPTISSVAPKNVSPLTTTSYTNAEIPAGANITVSTITSLPTLTNGSSPAVTLSTLPSFSPSPSLTFTFTTPSNANSQTASLLKIPPTNSRLPSASLPRHHTSSLVIQRTNTSPPPPLLPPSRTVQHYSQSQTPQSIQNSMSTIAIIPHRTYTERTASVTDIKRKMSNSGTREVHNKLEKNRRAHLKECFELLKSQVPAIQDEKKPSNLTILRTAIRYVTILRNREQQLEAELEKLAREKIINQQRLTTLKKELSAQWDHIDFNSLLPESVESKPNVENGADHKDYDMDREADKIAVMSDADDTSSQVKSRGDTYYGSSSSTGSCSISPLHISSPNMVSTTTDTLPPQIHIVESTSVPFDKLSNTTVVSPLQFLSTSALRMIADSEPIALVQHNGGEKLAESTTLPKMAVHTGNAFTIFSDSFQKVAASNNPVSGSSTVRNAKITNSSVQFTTGLTIPTVSVNHKNVTLPVKSGFSQVTSNGSITTSSVGERNSNTVLTTMPIHSNVGNMVNHSFVVTQPSSGQMLLTTATPHLSTNVVPTPLLKTVSRLQPINGHQLVVKPAMVVVSSTTAASK